MAGIPDMVSAIWSNSQKTFTVALVCWTLIAVDVGSTNSLVGARMLRLEINCWKIGNLLVLSTSPTTSILCGPMLWSMVTIESMLTETKHWVGFCYVIPHHSKEELDHFSPPWWLDWDLPENTARIWHRHGSANQTAQRAGIYLSTPSWTGPQRHFRPRRTWHALRGSNSCWFL